MASRRKLLFTTVIIVGTYFLFLGLFEARSFLAPLVTAITLSLLILPITQKLEKRMNRSVACLLSSLLLFLISIGVLALVSFQIRNFADDWPKIKETMKPKIEQVKQFALKHSPLSQEDIDKAEKSSNPSGSSIAQRMASFMSKLSSFVANYLLTFVYIFFLLNYRHVFRNFLIRIFPDERRDKAKDIMVKSSKVVSEYLVGKLILMGLLAILYSIGLGLSGVSNFIIVSLIAALLTLIPYIGNIIGFTMAVAFGFLTSGETSVLIGIALTFTITQFVESYVLQPYVVGDRVDVHPFFVILAVILGNMLWGIIGMVLAIPIMGIITVICLQISELEIIGKLLSKNGFKNSTEDN
ncbi:AI-2E family transporter [Gramella sp. GC03-9]|uniref:AI-2E family transporter n=1 Tax=Christiangramia oceanisediminis TaxID=2920386 RepID=A0A9X2KY22_9FLAO|nr:AI-2E family transporter [Gramella oceanisediminis]MCP9200403.1 AI-2E family transporter [Gramella oceanisediminis]